MSKIPGTILNPEFGSIEILRLQPGDVLVFTTDEGVRLDVEMGEAIKAALQGRFPNNECMIVSDGTLSVVRPEGE